MGDMDKPHTTLYGQTTYHMGDINKYIPHGLYGPTTYYMGDIDKPHTTWTTWANHTWMIY